MNGKDYISAFQMVGSRIKSFKLKNDFITLPEGKKAKYSFDVEHAVSGIDIYEGSSNLSGFVTLTIKAGISEERKKLSADVSIEGLFTAPGDMDPSVFRTMLGINGVTTLYAIARGFIQGVTSQSLASGCLLLPMFNVSAYSKDVSNKEGSAEL